MAKYTDEKNAQILISLLKKYNIRKVIASPGTTNIPLTGSFTRDSFFEVYSAYDERSAAYMACGLAYESHEPVVLTCTGATASRNYLPGLTEAFYRKIPILAITSMNSRFEVGSLLEQNIDRSVIPKDIAKISVTLDPVTTQEEFRHTELLVNKALLELNHHGTGPIHIQLITNYTGTFTSRQLPKTRKITRYTISDKWPDSLESYKKIGIFIGASQSFTQDQNDAVDMFCEEHNAIALTSNVSGYHGRYSVQSALVCEQLNHGDGHPKLAELMPNLIIHIGEQSGDYETIGFLCSGNAPVWRVSEDGELRDRFGKLQNVFECNPEVFFKKFIKVDDNVVAKGNTFFDSWNEYDSQVRQMIPDLPFSNIWIGKQLAPLIPNKSVVHFGILNSLRSWNNFKFHNDVELTSNVGGFGIDGVVSAFLGSTLADYSRLHFLILGDLAFFYDMNALGNRNWKSNARILLINNNTGMEFRLSSNIGSQFGESADNFIAAGRHNVNHFMNSSKNDIQMSSPAQAWAESLGFIYLSAHSKDEFEHVSSSFLSTDVSDRPILLECSTNINDEDVAHETIINIDRRRDIKSIFKSMIKTILPNQAIHFLKGIVK